MSPVTESAATLVLQWSRCGVVLNLQADELKEFTYWLFKYRLRTCAPPRVASDTTRGLERLRRLEALRRPAASTMMPLHDVLDLRASLA